MKNKHPLKTAIFIAVWPMLISGCVSTSPAKPVVTLTPEENAKLFAEQTARFSAIMPKLRQQSEGKDFLVSETGISKILDAVALGAAGESEQQIRSFISDKQLPLGNDKVYKNANLMYFANKKIIRKDYLKALSDFVVEDSLKAMNKKISKLTDGMITDGMSNVPPGASVVLSNVMAFNAKWASPFNEALTQDKDFTARCQGQPKVGKVATMHDQDKITYLKDGDVTAIALAFTDGYRLIALAFTDGYRLLIALPADKHASPDVATQWLLADKGKHIDALMQAPRKKVLLSLPKLNLSSEHNLIGAMRQLGITDIFDDKTANLSKVSSESLFVGLFEQKIKLQADEKGAKAAAVTTAVMLLTAAPPEPPSKPVVVDVDHPFAFAVIKANNPRQIVLAGEVNSLGVCDTPK